MSMIGKLRQISASELASFQEDPRKCYANLVAATPSGIPPEISPLMDIFKESPVMQKLQVEAGKVRWPASPVERAELQKEMMGLMERLKQLRAGRKKMDASAPNTVAASESPTANSSKELDLHKSWHCLHFLLTGTVEPTGDGPLRDAIVGGSEIPDEDDVMGYGPARVLAPDQVRAIADALANFPLAEKIQNYDVQAAKTAGIYVAEHEKSELAERFNHLLRFYQDAAAKGNGLLLWIE